MDKMFSLQGQLAVVTGGLGQLGVQFVKTLAAAGARVAVFDLTTEIPAALSDLVKRGEVFICETDVSSSASVLAAVKKIEETLGVPNILVNNAGWKASPDDIESGQPAENYPLDLWQKVLSINLNSALVCSQIIARQMIEKKIGGVIVNISSIYGLVAPRPEVYDYRAQTGSKYFKDLSYGVSKAGLVALTRETAVQWAPYGIRVVCLTLGGVERKESNPSFVAAYNKETPLGRMAKVDEYNGALLFSVSPSASYLTGSNLIIDGGWTAW